MANPWENDPVVGEDAPWLKDPVVEDKAPITLKGIDDKLSEYEKKAYGLISGTASAVAGLPAMIPQGIRNIVEAATPGVPLGTALERAQSTSEAIVPQPSTPEGQAVKQSIEGTLGDVQQGLSHMFSADTGEINKQRFAAGQPMSLGAENTESLVGDIVSGIYIPGMPLGSTGIRNAPKGPAPIDPMILKARENAKAAGRETVTAEDIKRAQQPWLNDPVQLEFPDEAMRGPQEARAVADAQARLEASREMARGDYQNMIESQAYLNLNRDLFDNPVARDPLLDTPDTLGGREKIAPELGTGPEHIDPIALNPQREAPTMGTQPGGTEGFTKPLDLTNKVEPSGASIPWNVRDAEVPRNIGQGELPLEARPMEPTNYTKDIFASVAPTVEVKKLPSPLANGNEWVVSSDFGNKQSYYRTEAEANAARNALEAARAISEQRTTLRSQIAEKVNQNDFRGTLETIAQKAMSPWERELAKTLLKDPEGTQRLVVAPIITEEMSGMRTTPGSVTRGLHSSDGVITLDKQFGVNPATILHEAIHSKLSRLITLYERGMALPNAVTHKAISNLSHLYNYVKDVAGKDMKGMYGLTDMHEFISEGLTNPEFRSKLADIQVVPKGKHSVLGQAISDVKTAAGIFLREIAKAVGLPLKDHNSLSLLLNETDKLFTEIRTNGRVSAAAYGKLNFDNVALSLDNPTVFSKEVPPNRASVVKPDSLAEYMDKVEAAHGDLFAKQFGKTLHEEYLKQWKLDNAPRPKPIGFDNRTHEAFKEDLFRKDGTPRIDDINILQGRLVGHVSADAHPVIRRVYDAASQATNVTDTTYNRFMRNATVEEKGAFSVAKGRFTGLATVQRVEAADSVSALYKKLNDKDMQSVLEITNSNPRSIVENDALMAAKGASPKAIQFLKANAKMVDATLAEINAARAKRGMEPIKDNPNFWASQSRMGAFHTYSIDPSTGKSSFLAGFNNFAEAQKVAEAMTRQTGQKHVAAASEHNPRNATSPGEAFVDAINTVEDAASKAAIQEAFDKVRQRLGINKYAMARDSSAGGYAGSKQLINTLGGKSAFTGYFDAIDNYARSAARYIADTEYAPRVGELFGDTKIAKEFHNARARAMDMWDDYKGVADPMTNMVRDYSKIISQLVGGATSKVAGVVPFAEKPLLWIGRSVTDKTIERGIQDAGNFFTMNQIVMWNPVFYIANAMQHSVVPAYMQRLKATTLAGKGDIVASELRGIAHMQMPSEYSMSIFKEALKNGSLEPRFIEAMDWMRSESTLASAAKLATGERLAAYSDMYSRGVAYAQLFEFGKSAGMDEKLAHSFAARESQGIMINHAKWARMPILNKLGPVGTAVAPLTSFVTNFGARLGDYIKSGVFPDQVSGQRSIAPLLNILAVTTAIAGVKGLPFHDDMEKALVALNALYVAKFGGTYQGIPQDLISKYVPDVLNNGILSTALGVSASGTAGVGQLAGALGQAAGLKQYSDVVDAFGSFLVDKIAGGSVPDAEKLKAIKAVTPPMGKYAEDALLSNKKGTLGEKLTSGTTVVDSGGNAVYTRSGEEQVRSTLLGKPSLAEAEAKKQKYINETMKNAERDAKSTAIDKLVDSVMSGKPVSDFTLRVFRNYPEVMDNVDEGVETALINRQVPYKERERIKTEVVGAIQRLQKVYK